LSICGLRLSKCGNFRPTKSYIVIIHAVYSLWSRVLRTKHRSWRRWSFLKNISQTFSWDFRLTPKNVKKCLPPVNGCFELQVVNSAFFISNSSFVSGRAWEKYIHSYVLHLYRETVVFRTKFRIVSLRFSRLNLLTSFVPPASPSRLPTRRSFHATVPFYVSPIRVCNSLAWHRSNDTRWTCSTSKTISRIYTRVRPCVVDNALRRIEQLQ